MNHSRCKWLLSVVAATLANIASAGGPNSVPPARDLRNESAQAESACVPLLLEFAADACEYCVLLEEDVLKPMLLNPDYRQRVRVRKITLNAAARLGDFDGQQVSAALLAERYRINVTPTLLFVGSHGDELAERMVGVTTLDFYGGYLDQALDFATETLRGQKRCR